jgi:hypothetical protein
LDKLSKNIQKSLSTTRMHFLSIAPSRGEGKQAES